MLRFRIPVIGPMLRKRAERRFSRQMREALQRSFYEARPDVVRAVHEAMTRPAPGYREIASEGGIRWHQRIDGAQDAD